MATFRAFLDRLAEMEGTAFASWTEAMKATRVAHMNAALRWGWKTDDPLFAFPFTVSTATVTVTGGKISPTDLGGKSWCSLWESDPRPAGASRRNVEAHVSNTGVYPYCAATSVFAFFRTAVPQTAYESGSEYEGNSSVVTITVASPAVVSWTAHGLSAGSEVIFTTTGALPTGITAGTTYFVLAAGLTANAFEFAATAGGAAITTSGIQSGVHTATEAVEDIPDDLLDMVSLKALYTLFVSIQQWDAVNALQKSYGDPAKQREALVVALRESGMIWDGYAIALTPAAA